MKEQNRPLFGVAGFPPAFFESEYRKKRSNIFEWLHSISLDWVELQNTYGVKMKESQAREYHDLAAKYDIGISLHAPYFVTLASGDPEVVKRSIERIFQCFWLAEIIGASRIIFHPGFYNGKSDEDRKNGLNQLIQELLSIKDDVPKGIFLYAETAGKCSQLGSLEEIVTICEAVPFVKPCLDVAHVHAFRHGSLKSTESIVETIDYVEQLLGREVLSDLHFHMYPVEVDRNGEKRHRAFFDRTGDKQMSLFEDTDDWFYPRPEHFVSAIKQKGICPVVVCEALNSQEQGASLMKQLYEENNK